MSLDPRIVQLLNDFADSQPALRFPGEPLDSSNPLLGDVFDAMATAQSGSNDYSGAGSFQVLAPDLNVSADVGSDDGANPKFVASIMGNIIGEDLENDANYLAGVIGAYSITGTKSTTYPAGAVLAQISDGVTAADGAFVAYVDGDSSLTKANAAFKAMSNNSTAGSGFDYGMDLYSPAHDGYNALAILKALERSPHEVCRFEGSGVPSDGGSGAGVGFAGKGSLYSDYTNGEAYINTGSKASPTWKKLTHA